MTTKASNSVLNLVSPPIDEAVIVDLTVNNLLTVVQSLAHSVLIGEGVDSVVSIAPGTAGQALISNGASADPSFQPVNVSLLTGILSVAHGGTGDNTFPVGDVIVGAGSSPLVGISPSTAGNVLTSNGVGVDPSFQPPAGPSGVLPVANGGTGEVNFPNGAVLLGDGTLPINYAIPSADPWVLTSNGVGITPSFQQITTSMISGLPVVLTGDRIYYVWPSGSDSTGIGSLGAPWATLQHAANWVIQNLNFNGYTVTIQMADGTYTQGLSIVGAVPGNLIINGNNSTPSSTIVDDPTNNGFAATAGASYSVYSAQISAPNAACVSSSYGGTITVKNISWGASINAHIYVFAGGSVQVVGDTEIISSAPSHATATLGGIVFLGNAFSIPHGTPADTNAPGGFTGHFPNGFVSASDCGIIYIPNNTWSVSCGSDTPPVNLASNAVVHLQTTPGPFGTTGGTLPGTASSLIGTGGQFWTP